MTWRLSAMKASTSCGLHLRDSIHSTLWIPHSTQGGLNFGSLTVNFFLMQDVAELYPRHDYVSCVVVVGVRSSVKISFAKRTFLHTITSSDAGCRG